MRHQAKEDDHPEDIGPRRGLLVGTIAAVIVVALAIFGLLAIRQLVDPREPLRPELPLAADRDQNKRLHPDPNSNGEGALVGPLTVPDGGWLQEPRSLEQMDTIPEGVLRQGSIGNDGDEDETPAGDVFISAFYIDHYEITNEQYEECVGEGVCRPPIDLDRTRFRGPRQPVVGVNWYDASTFCRWAGKRLPTEAEWERAARGDIRRTFPWGDTPPDCSAAILTQCDRYGPAEVGGRQSGAGPFGTQDLAGNVWEWVQDWYAPRYYPSEPEGDPVGPPAGQQRVLRGGSWHFGPQYARSANRHRDDPTKRVPWYGFRCAFSAPQEITTTSQSAQPDAGPDGNNLEPSEGLSRQDAGQESQRTFIRSDASL